MTDLIIELPKINNEWIEENFSELLADGWEFFRSIEPKSLEFSIGSLGYAKAYESMTDWQHNNFHQTDFCDRSERESRDQVKNIF